MSNLLKSVAFNFLVMLLVGCAGSSNLTRVDDHKDDPYYWPRTYVDHKKSKITLHQPQITDWEDFKKIKARVVVEYHPPNIAKPLLGTFSMEADTDVNVELRQVHAGNFKISNLRFSDTKLVGETELLQESLVGLLIEKARILSLDRLSANFERNQSIIPVKLKTDPPQIFVSESPAILVLFNGKPEWAAIENVDLQFAVNTNWDVFRSKDKKTYYLRNFDGWLSAPTLNGPWSAGVILPEVFSQLPDDENWSEVKQHIPGVKLTKEAAPDVYLSVKPAELILMSDKPNLQFVGSTTLQWIANTESDVFYYQEDQHYYYLVSGRWFRSLSLDNESEWEFATPDLPELFKLIPLTHERAHVRASIPGTPEAKEAVLMAQMPRKVDIKLGSIHPEVKFNGAPQFRKIEGTDLAYAVNTASDVIRVNNQYYLCQDAVWFVSESASGPWVVATEVPQPIYQMPSSSPVYHTTYVHVYDYHHNHVTVGYTAGYSNVYFSFGVMMYGSGWYYPPYYYYDPFYTPYPVYYSYPYTYGAATYYNPYSGVYGRGIRHYGPYGGAGYGYAYNLDTGRYLRGGAAYGPYNAGRWTEAYNPRTNTYALSAKGTNYYDAWGASIVQRNDDWLATRKISNDQGGIREFKSSGGKQGFIGYDNDNLYAGKDGNVYRRNAEGWQQRSQDGSWKDTDIPIERTNKRLGQNVSPSNLSQERSRLQSTKNMSSEQLDQIKTQREQREGNLKTGTRQAKKTDRSSIDKQLNNDYSHRQRGNQRLNSRRSSNSWNYGNRRSNISGSSRLPSRRR